MPRMYHQNASALYYHQLNFCFVSMSKYFTGYFRKVSPEMKIL